MTQPGFWGREALFVRRAWVDAMKSAVKTMVVSYQPPTYSEVWMDRMTNMLRPDVEAVYVLDRNRSSSTDGIPEHFLLPPGISRLPPRLVAGLGGRWITRNMMRVLQSVEAGTSILVHYLTLAVCIRDALFQCRNPVFVHCHGFDVTWRRRNERFSFLPDHPASYVPQVVSLGERVTFIANSMATSEKLQEIGIPENRIVLKYIGVPIPSENRAHTTAINGEFTILYLGRLTDFKGPVETIRAFARAVQRGLNGRLIIAGGGSQRKACEREVAKLGIAGCVSMLGPVSAPRVTELLARTHIFTAHNQQSPRSGQEEAFGVSVVEAMAAGIPVVTGRSGGVCETVVDGETGILFQPGDIDAHADALLRLSQDETLRVSMGSNGYQRAAGLFSLELEAVRLREILATTVRAPDNSECGHENSGQNPGSWSRE